MHSLDDAHSVGGAVEKVRIAEGYVLRSGFHLLAYVGHHYVSRDYAEGSVINRHNRTVTAKMLAAPAGLRVSSDAIRFAVEHGGVSRKGRQTGAVRRMKTYAFQREQWLRRNGSITFGQP
jgi:hypothetical protein